MALDGAGEKARQRLRASCERAALSIRLRAAHRPGTFPLHLIISRTSSRRFLLFRRTSRRPFRREFQRASTNRAARPNIPQIPPRRLIPLPISLSPSRIINYNNNGSHTSNNWFSKNIESSPLVQIVFSPPDVFSDNAIRFGGKGDLSRRDNRGNLRSDRQRRECPSENGMTENE